MWGGLFKCLCLQGFFHLGPVGDGGDCAFSGDGDGGCLGAHSQNFGNGQALAEAGQEVAGEGVAGGGGIHGLDLEDGLVMLLGCVGVHRAVAAQGQDDLGMGVQLQQTFNDVIGRGLAGDLAAFHFVQQEDGDLAHIHGIQLLIKRRRIQGDGQAALVCLIYNVRHLVDLVLQQQHVTLAEVRQDLIHVLFGQALVRAAVEEDAVLGVLVDLDDGMARGGGDAADVVGVDAVLGTGIQEGLAVGADHAAMVGGDTGLGQSHGLVHALAAQENVHIQGGLGLTGLHHMVHGIDMVQIHGADVQNSHGVLLIFQRNTRQLGCLADIDQNYHFFVSKHPYCKISNFKCQ